MSKTQILVVDDEEVLVKSITRALQREYDILSAYNGMDGLRLARQEKPDLIILDIIMPGMDGYQTCRELRQDPLLKTTPILFLTALSTIESKITGFEAGADDYLPKPFDIRELGLRIKAILRRSQEQEEANSETALLTHNDINLNLKIFEVTTKNGAHHLTPVEFDLLHHFIRHPGQVFSSNELLRQIWGYSSSLGNASLVRMHIKNLRQKIEPNPKKPIYLKTIPRHGYFLSE